MKVVVITQENDSENELELLNSMLDEGLHTLHIRKPGYDKAEMVKFIHGIKKKHHKRLVLHSHHGLALKYKLKGIHLPEYSRRSLLKYVYSYWVIHKLLKPRIRVSASYHNIQDILSISGKKYHFVFLSPVFKSISKNEYKPTYSLSKLQDKLRETNVKVYALGGVDENNLIVCQNVGFVGVGLLGAIWQDKQPLEKFVRINNLCIHNLLHP
jgi:thiamine-phosphate pyrophosphorylase